jgi:hypothetical protein
MGHLNLQTRYLLQAFQAHFGVNVKVNAMKAYKGSEGIPPLILNPDT